MSAGHTRGQLDFDRGLNFSMSLDKQVYFGTIARAPEEEGGFTALVTEATMDFEENKLLE